MPINIYIYIYTYLFEGVCYFIYYLSYITSHISNVDCLLICLDAHMFSHNGYRPGTEAQGPRPTELQVPQAVAHQPLGPWGLGAGPISSVAELIIFCALRATDRQYFCRLARDRPGLMFPLPRRSDPTRADPQKGPNSYSTGCNSYFQGINIIRALHGVYTEHTNNMCMYIYILQGVYIYRESIQIMYINI